MSTAFGPTNPEMSDEQFRSHALGILERELGATGVARFVRIYGRTYQDYTRERHRWQKGITVDQLANDIEALRKARA